MAQIKVTHNIENSQIALDAAEIPNLDAAKITTGTLADARISASSVTQHSAPTDLQPIKSDISALALREATNESSAAFNLPNQFIDTFATDTLGTKTDVLVTGGYVSSSNLGNKKTLTKAAIYANATAYAVWQFRASNDASSWTNLGNTMSVSGGSEVNSGTFSNTTAYRYYEFYKTDSAQGGQYHRRARLYENGSEISYTGLTSSSGRLTQSGLAVSNLDNMFDGDSTSSSSVGFHTDSSGVGSYFRIDFNGIGDPEVNATGTAIQNTNTVGSAKTKVGGTILYKDNSGTATLGTDLKIYFTCNGGTNWTEATSYSAITPVYSTGIKQVRLGETTCTSGTDIRYKAVWANQASGSKETQLHGIGINY